jgi:ubiquitin-protein ligase
MSMGMTHVLENFRRSVSDMSPSGDTALFDALALAKDQLVEKGKDFPNAKKRIICISDGVDTKSTTNTASEISWRLREAGITLDSVSLGDEENLDLRTISYVLGAYRFHPTTLTNALAICELEPFLSITERPPLSPPTLPRNRLEFMAKFYQMKYQALFTVANEDVFPPRKSHPNIDDEFVELTAAAARPNAVNSTSGSRSNLRTSRLLNEMRAIANSSHPTYDVYVSETDMSFWKVVMSGPDESPYSEGTFLLYLHADEGYPTFAPKARFITRMKHPNINTHGRVCHSIFDRDWTSDTSMTTLLDSIYGLLLQPEYSDPVNTMSTLGFHHDQVEFADEVREHVENNASRSRESWKKLLLEGVDDDMPDSGEDFDSSSGVEDEEVDDEDVDETYW